MKKSSFNKNEFDRIERETITKKEFDDTMRQILTAPVSDSKSENREPTMEELNQKYKLVRK